MPFRTDEQIRGYLDESMRQLGRPRCLFIAGLLPHINLEPSDDEFLEFVFPFDTDAWRRAASPKMSSCGLFARAGWRYAGVDDPEIYEPYEAMLAKGGTHFAVAHEKYFAEQINKAQGVPCWVDGIRWEAGTPLPPPSSTVIIGCASCPDFSRGTPNFEHEFTVGAYDPEIPTISHNLDGGQPGTRFRSRGWVEVAGELWCGAVNDDGSVPLGFDGRPAIGRRVVGYVDTSYLPTNPPPDHTCATSDGDVVTTPGGGGGGPLSFFGGGDGLLVPAVLGTTAFLALTPQGRALAKALWVMTGGRLRR